MRYCLSRLFSFIILFVLMFGFVGYVNKIIFRSYLNDKALYFGPEITTLIVGDSHTLSSLDPSIIKGSVNISLSSENYYFTYYKLKYLLKYNPQIRNIILGLSYHNISKSYEDAFLFNKDKMKDAFDTYYPLIDDGGKRVIYSVNAPFVENFMRYEFGVPIKLYKNDLFIKRVFNIPIYKKDYPFLGDYYRSDNSNVNDKLIKLKAYKYFYSNDNYGGTSYIMIEYLYKMIELCHKYGIKVYLYNSPLHVLFKERIPLPSINDFDVLIKRIENRYSDSYYINYSDINLEDRCFGDGDHVNSSGATIVSMKIHELINTPTSGEN